MATRTKTAARKGRDADDRGKMIPLSRAEKKAALPPQSGRKSKEKLTTLGRADAAYLILIQCFPLRPIRTDAELDAASRIIDELIDRDDLSLAERDYLDVLSDLVEK